MSDRELSEVELEALAHGRRDLVGEARAREVERDEALAGRIERERDASRDASVALKRAAPELDDLDAMIARAMQHAPPEPGHGIAPSRASLWIGAAVGVAVALASGTASLVASRGPVGLVNTLWTDVAGLARLGVALGLTLDRYVMAIPGGWAAVAAIGLALFAVIALPLRAIAAPWRTPGPSAAAALALAILGTSTGARAYDVEGAWPEPDARVSVGVERAPRSEALRQALASAGLGLAYALPEDPPVTLHVREAPLREVLDALLGATPAQVRHSGHMVVVRPPAASEGVTTVAPASDAPPAPAEGSTSAPAPAEPPAAAPLAAPPVLPPPPPVSSGAPAPPTGELRDVVSFGGDARVLPDQQVRDVLTMGGDAHIEGQVYGNVVTMGGDAEIHGTVVGDVVTMGGNLRVRPGGHVHGQLNAMGGRITVDDLGSSSAGSVHLSFGTPSTSTAARASSSDWLGDAIEAAMRYALLFLLGLLFMGLAPERLRGLQTAIVKLPLRSLASGFLGAIAAAVLTVVLVITILGIPAAVVLALGLFFGGYLGLATTASVLGGALPIPTLKERPVLQLATGVLLLFLVSRVPVVGGLLVVGATLVGLGAVILTRLGQKQIDGSSS